MFLINTLVASYDQVYLGNAEQYKAYRPSSEEFQCFKGWGGERGRDVDTRKEDGRTQGTSKTDVLKPSSPDLSNSPTKIALFYILSFYITSEDINIFIQYGFGASLVAQWLRICLLMQETRVRALVWEDPTSHGAAGPVSHSC